VREKVSRSLIIPTSAEDVNRDLTYLDALGIISIDNLGIGGEGVADLFKAWADRAVQQMRFSFDRAPVREELLAHLEDRRQDYIDRGLSEDEAGEQALMAMGDAVETGRLLNKAHAPILGWAWLVSTIVCGLLAFCLVLWIGLNRYGDVFAEFWEAMVLDEPCRMTEWFDEHNVPYTFMDDTMTLELGDYTMELDHSFYAVDDVSYEVYLGWQVRTWKPWLEFPKGIYEITVEDSFGNVWNDRSAREWGKPHAEFYFNTTGGILPVWQFHLELLYLPGEAFPEWLRFTIPNSNASFTVYLDGEVRS